MTPLATPLVNPLVIGVGNRWRGDDGVGPCTIEALARIEGLDAELLTLDGEPARLVAAWQGRSVVVIVDAIVTGDPHLATFAAGAAQSIAIPLTSNSAKVSSLLGDTYNSVIAGQMTGEEGAQKIYDELPALLTP